MTTYLAPIQEMLRQKFPQPNPLWNYSADNTIADRWLLATPTDVWGLTYDKFKQAVPGTGPLGLRTCTVANGNTQLCQPMDAGVTTPGDTPQRVLIGHSDDMVEAVYDLMISAEVLLDITTLTPPTERFLDAFKNALLYLSRKPAERRPIVRILYSDPLPNIPPLTAGPFLQDIVSDLDPAARMRIYLYVMSSSFASWNHSKIVAADGVRALVGGHNMWGPHYLGVNPVNDVSMRLTGTAARHAQDFADGLWAFSQWRQERLDSWIRDKSGLQGLMQGAYQPASAAGGSVVQPGVLPDPALYATASARFPAAPGPGTVPVLAVGRGGNTRSTYLLPTLASYAYPFDEPADEAIVMLVGQAKQTVRMSLQSFRLAHGWVAGWNRDLLGAMAAALNRGVDVFVVTSNPGAVAGGLSKASAPYDGDRPGTVIAELIGTLVEREGLSRTEAERVAQARLHVADFRYSADQTYPGGTPISNHAKTLIVDDAAFYIGSQNVYSSNLNEFGYIIEDAAAAQTFVTRYWTPLWDWSRGTASSEPDTDVAAGHEIEAMQFILALPFDTLLNVQWTGLKQQYDTAGTPQAKAAAEAAMDQLISSAGFDTTTATVVTGLSRPFFTETPPSTAATTEALRFVANLMNSPSLMVAFDKVAMASYDTVDDANKAITAFLSAQGYSCTALEVRTALSVVQNKALAYWSGSYTVWLTGDGGRSYANTAVPGPADGDPLPALGPQLVVTADGVTYDGVAVIKPDYDDNALSWSTTDGNATSASLRFGTVTRQTLNDSFVGSECFGTITKNGTVQSLYGRVQTSPDDPDQRGSNTLLYVLGTLALVAFLAALGLGLLSLQRKAEWMRQAQEKRDSDRDTDETELEPMITPGRAVESSLIRRAVLTDRIGTAARDLTELSRYESGMKPEQRIELSSCGGELHTASRALADPPAAALPETVGAQSTVLDGTVTRIQKIAADDARMFSATTRESLERSAKLQKQIGDMLDDVVEQEKDGKPFEFDEEEDLLSPFPVTSA